MPALVLDGAPLPMDASIRNFQQGKANYVANAVEQALLLPKDMANLRSLRKHEVFLSLKRNLVMVSQLPTLLFFYHSNKFFFWYLYFAHLFIYYFLKGHPGCPQS